jgi:hypothetical protein
LSRWEQASFNPVVAKIKKEVGEKRKRKGVGRNGGSVLSKKARKKVRRATKSTNSIVERRYI